ncbi:hypothetical protein CDEST_02042 [Colletotrichum destructivum]|uniref:Uncharacterized protein n=1 Tax=Colletotrichum destructivum TaxID=34406 RepID=A0AAX4I0U5_9PEZI|nr:hypothetical protein CDEST_02042 [Colletotrichum destructivum]
MEICPIFLHFAFIDSLRFHPCSMLRLVTFLPKHLNRPISNPGYCGAISFGQLLDNCPCKLHRQITTCTSVMAATTSTTIPSSDGNDVVFLWSRPVLPPRKANQIASPLATQHAKGRHRLPPTGRVTKRRTLTKDAEIVSSRSTTIPDSWRGILILLGYTRCSTNLPVYGYLDKRGVFRRGQETPRAGHLLAIDHERVEYIQCFQDMTSRQVRDMWLQKFDQARRKTLSSGEI